MKLVEKNSISIEHLKEQINLIQESVYFHLTVFWSILGVIIAALSIALVIVIRKWVKKRVDKEIEEFKRELRAFENHWYRPTLLNGWYLDDFETLTITKDYLGFVHIKGAIKGGIINSQPFSLPNSYRPLQITTFGVVAKTDSNHTVGFFTIMPSGETILNITTNDIIYLNGISFIAEDEI